MDHRCRLFVRAWMTLAAWIALAIAAPVWAQDDDAPKPKPKPKAAAPKAASPKAVAPKAAKPQEKADPAEPVQVTASEDPAVDALLKIKSDSPAQWVRTAQILVHLHRPELAKPLLQKILAAKLDDAQLAALSEQYGSTTFTELANEPGLRPEGEQLSQAILGAANRQIQDAKRIAQLIKSLQDPSPDTRARAMAGLEEAHGAAVVALIGVLADPTRAAEHPVAKAALAEMRGDAIEPLVGMLDHAEPQLAIQAIGALAEMQSPAAALYLLGPALAEKGDPKVRAAAQAAIVRLVGSVPNKQEAAELLRKQAESYFQKREHLKTGPDGRVVLWQWDTAAKRCISISCSTDEAFRILAARLARTLLAVAPDDPKAQQFSLTAMLDEAASHGSLDKPWDVDNDPAAREVAALGTPTVEAILEYAMAENHPAAARAAAEILGRSGKTKELLCQRSSPSPLVRAVRSPDRRLRLAALEAIVRLKPDCPFAGSSHVIESLAQLVATNGVRRAILAGPNSEVLQEWVGLLSSMHIQTDKAGSGREVLRLALHSPDYELVLIDTALGNADSVVQQLRHDYRTATLRVGLIARAGDFERADRIAREDRQAMSFPRPRDRKAVQFQMDQLATIAPRDFVTFQERQQEAARALTCLATLASTSRKLYDVRRIDDAVTAAIRVPGLGIRAAAVLANVGTPDSQTALVELASRAMQPLDVRQAAAKAFHISTQRYGLLLSRDAVRLQADRYAQSEGQDAATRDVLQSIVKSIEAKRQQSPN